LRAALERKISLLRERGAAVKEVSLPHTEATVAAYSVLTTAEASSNLARFDGARYGRRAEGARELSEMYVRSRIEGFGDEVKRRIMLGTYVLSAGYYDAFYRKGEKVRRLIRDDFTKAFREVDCLLTPTTPTTAFPIGEKTTPLAMYLSDVYTVSANLAGIPAVSVPCGVDRASLPIGLQVLGRPFEEETVLRVAEVLEERR
jgi:aspartyl-tRNA(Asn)/glutamyl-tRNA(Gln) amidotransferase subunit A